MQIYYHRIRPKSYTWSELKAFLMNRKTVYDQNVPFLFVQKNHFTEIWNIGVSRITNILGNWNGAFVLHNTRAYEVRGNRS